MLKMKNLILHLMVGAVVFTSCGGENQQTSENTGIAQEDMNKDNTLTAAEKEENWQLLFDGTSTDGWRGFNQDELPENWVVEDGTFKSLGTGGDIGGDIVYGAEEFGEFELYLEWRIAEGGNSGIFYHVVEDEKYPAPYHTGPEYQLIDQIGFPQKLEDWQSIGGDYGMYTPDYEGAVKPAGEWNSSRIIFTEEEVSYWLNGQKTLSFVPWSEDWEKRKAEGKWKDFPDYGTAKSGLIGLQDHGSFIWFKNIKIRKL